MTIDRDDPRLTAYALDELDAAEREAIEKELAGDTTARAEIEEIAALSRDLEQALADEPQPSLTDTQRDKITAAAPRPRARSRLGYRLAAASIVLTVCGMVIASMLTATQQWARPPSDRDGVFHAFEPRGAVEDKAEPARPADVSYDVSQARNVGVPVGDVRRLKEKLRADLKVSFEAESVDGLRLPTEAPSTEGYDRIDESPFQRTSEEHTSTFSIDVDTASYANVRRFLLRENRLPPKDAVRIEELINYFRYGYTPPPNDASHPFAAHVQVAACPWNPEHRLARIALQGKTMKTEQRPPTNLVFLIDVSGSMRSADKLPLLKKGLGLLVDALDEGDRIAMVVYAGAAGLVLPSTTGDRKEEIQAALEGLQSGGSTNGGAGIQLAYRVAREHFIPGGVNRVVLATDGDFNVGTTDNGSLTRMIEEKAQSGVFLSVLGFGTRNVKDDRMEQLSNRGNGNYAYIDSLKEARKVLVEELTGTLVTIAKDVKIQVFFNPRTVAGYRLVGYENRRLAARDFNDDTKDAGEIGAGHAVTALYEIVPAGRDLPGPRVDPNPFVEKEVASPPGDEKALFRLRLRYKQPEGDKSTLMEQDVFDGSRKIDQSDDDFQWAAAVAGFGMLLRDSPHRGLLTWEAVAEIAGAAGGPRADEYRAEFLRLVEKARALTR